MIRFDDVTVTYPEADRPVLEHVDLTIPEGELCLVVGSTGSGKSTLLKCINGLVPHFTGGRRARRGVVGGRGTQQHPPRRLAPVVGYLRPGSPPRLLPHTRPGERAHRVESPRGRPP